MIGTTIIFGEDACRAWAEGNHDLDAMLDLGHVETFTFETEAELNAFSLGLEAAIGWLDFTYADDMTPTREEITPLPARILRERKP